ncbi:hypothetical protein [Haloferula sp.]|uniref:hypothetical protein n=1 Tax=Haloferula sp. TaxID=2497595 RepID=UPI00329B06B3
MITIQEMSMKRRGSIGFWTVLLIGVVFFPVVDQVRANDGLDPVDWDDEGLGVWAATAEIVRGPVDATVPDGAVASFGSVADVIGVADSVPGDPYPVASLGDGGVATLRFSIPVADGPGADIAVFENAFDSTYLELAHVEVSSDGIHFTRFPSVSGTQSETQIGGLQSGGIDPGDLINLAGAYPGGEGTPFDLAELRGLSPWLDVSRITHVRVIDVVGSVDPAYGTRDSLGNLINDPWKTNFTTGGFDLDAVGAFYPAPVSHASWLAYHFPMGGSTGDEEDPDGDGIENLVEFALGSDPLFWSAVPLRVMKDGVDDLVQWMRASEREGVDVTLQVGDDPAAWTDMAGSEGTGDVLAIGSGVDVFENEDDSQVTTSFATSSGRRFFRLEVQR